MNVWSITDIGAVRLNNQDCFRIEWLSTGELLVVVCDGMGGARAGNVASVLAAETFVETVKRCCNPLQENWHDVLQHAVLDANQAVYSESNARDECHGMGTTLVACLVTSEKVWVVNVGDSRCYRICETEIIQITRDHSLVEDLVESGEITPAEARVHPRKNLITRALGVDFALSADIYEISNIDGYLLLCSDGLSNMLSDEEMQREVLDEDKEHCCQRLLNLALDYGAPDNITVVVVQL